MDAELAHARGALVLARELDPLEKHGKTDLSDWLCTHWPRSRRMPPMEPEERFSANLRRLRAEKGLSQEELAGRADLHASEISRLERGVREPRLRTLARLARALGVPVGELVSGIE